MSIVTPSIEDNGLPVIDIRPEEIHQPFPLTDLQNAYWIGRSAAFELGRVAAHAYFEFESEEALDVNRLTETWRRLIARHGTLRAIVRADGQQQILEDVPPYDIQLLDLRDKEPHAAEIEGLAVRERLSHRTRPTDQWPLFDVTATRLPGNRLRVHLSIDLLLVDFASISILLKEWAALYLNPDIVLPEIDISFRDYVLANAALEGSGPFESSRAYWQKRLHALAPPPELPATKAKNTSLDPRFLRHRGRLEADAWQKFKDYAADEGLTPSSALLAVFALVIGTWSKNQRFTLDLTVFNRLPFHPHVNRLVGDFTSNTLLPVEQLSEGSFADFGTRLQEQVFQDMEHRYFSGVRVLREWARLHKGTPRLLTPIVFTSAVGALGPGEEDSPWQWLGKMIYSVSQTPQVSLDHSLYPDGDALIFNWDVMEGLFPSGMVEEMFGVYEKLLRRLGEEQEIWQMPTRELLRVLLPNGQVEQRMAVNATAAPLPQGWLHTGFAEQARQRPQQTAVITPTRSLSYEELFRRANQLAHRLRRLGVQPNSLVAVAMEKGWEQVVAVLGILTAGAAYLPVDPTLPQERMEYLLQHGQVNIVLTQQDGKEKPWLKAGLSQIVVDDSLQQEPSTWLEPVQKTSDLAYVIYTSGSTGLPKGVMISHAAALNTVVDVNQRFRIGSGDRIFGLSSLSFDLSVYDIFGTLAAGATLVLPRAGSMRDPAHWAEIMTAAQVTVWNSVPALMEMLVEYASGRQVKIPLRLVLLSGDWIPVSLPERLWQWIPGVELISMGGATEAAIWSILYPVEQVDPNWESIPYGKPMVNQRFHVLNEGLEACPVWVPGQLHIAGEGLAEGYWRDPERSGSSFFTHPRTGERLYRTGDLGRYLPDGNIEFLGREDFQVKVHGHRIELGEIEAALTQHPLLRTAIVTAQGKSRTNKRLVAYVVPAEPETIHGQSSSSPLTDGFDHEGESDYGDGVITDPIKRLEFKAKQPGLRRDNSDVYIQLLRPAPDDPVKKTYAGRSSKRRFLHETIAFEKFSNFLNCLGELRLDSLPKYRYGSAGGLYPVQLYLYVKPQRVHGLEEGTYYYHPQQHRLFVISRKAVIDQRLHFPVNRELFGESAFSLFLVGQFDAIKPLYGTSSRDFCLLEAGLMTQLLESSAADNQLGLCQIGKLKDLDTVKSLFKLDETHVVLHSMVGGSPSHASTLEVVKRDAGVAHSKGSLISELRQFVQKKLPNYMVPASFVVLDKLPLSANGKLDRNALPDIGEQGLGQGDAPRTETEKAIAQVFQEVLQISQIGTDSNFFDLGSDSVEVVIVHRKLNHVLGDFPLLAMFEHPTVSRLARYIKSESNGKHSFSETEDRARKQKEALTRQQNTRARA